MRPRERFGYFAAGPKLSPARDCGRVGVAMSAIGNEGAQIEASFLTAIRVAREHKSSSLATRAEATYAEFRRRKGERYLPL